MLKRRARNVVELGWASFQAEWSGRCEHLPHWQEYPDALVERIAFGAGGGLGWRLSALRTPRVRTAPWKIVVITGAPSWAEYWTCVLAKLGSDREMVVVDRPGFGASEPAEVVTDIDQQVKALLPVLATAKGQKLLLVGQSYGAGIAATMASARPDCVDSLLLISPLWGETGPTAASLVAWGHRIRGMIPRDLRNAVAEVMSQPPQLPRLRQALGQVRAPTRVVHGEQDDFAPIEGAKALAAELEAAGVRVSFRAVTGDHFLTTDPPDLVLEQIEAAIAAGKTPRNRLGLGRALAWARRLVPHPRPSLQPRLGV